MPSHSLGIYIWKVHFCSMLCYTFSCEIMFFFSNVIWYSLVYSIVFLNWLRLSRKLEESLKCVDFAFFHQCDHLSLLEKYIQESKTELLATFPYFSLLVKKSLQLKQDFSHLVIALSVSSGHPSLIQVAYIVFFMSGLCSVANRKMLMIIMWRYNQLHWKLGGIGWIFCLKCYIRAVWRYQHNLFTIPLKELHEVQTGLSG